MRRKHSIITVGLCPTWDMMCRAAELEWGLHQQIDSCSNEPAGKALNISRALAWMGEQSVAAGLWGQEDYGRMLEAAEPLRRLVKFAFTRVEGRTRQNVTVVETKKGREMHLRSPSRLASPKVLRQLKVDLERLVGRQDVCVFAGAMPDESLWPAVEQVVKACRQKGAKIAVDSSGSALRWILGKGRLWLIKPNVRELGELVGRPVADNVASLAGAGRKLLGQVEIVLISRAKKGAVVVARDGAWQGRCNGGVRRAASTVGCGDYLLAGFLQGLKETTEVRGAMETGIKVAAARAWGWADSVPWTDAGRKIKVQVRRV